MSNINFNLLGESMSFNAKLLKHINAENPERVKDYLCAGFDSFNPKNIKCHPCLEMIRYAENFMRDKGWKCGLYNWGPEKGVQYTCVSPNDEWYRSHYQH